ncbi:MAG: hypothetical protein R2751_14510 [Bacteroidales bacterium]
MRTWLSEASVSADVPKRRVIRFQVEVCSVVIRRLVVGFHAGGIVVVAPAGGTGGVDRSFAGPEAEGQQEEDRETGDPMEEAREAGSPRVD